MKKNPNKIIGPVVWAAIFAVIIGGYFILFALALPFWLTILVLTAGFAVVAALIFVLLQRIKEIKEEDDNDFSKY